MNKRVAIVGSVVVLGAACAGSPKQASAPAAPPDDAPRERGAVSGEAVCAKILTLKQEGCAFLADYDLGQAECVADYQQSVADSPAETEAVGRCFVQASDCDAVTACVDSVIASKPQSACGGGGDDVPDNMQPLRCCDEEGYGAVGYPRAEWAVRRGAGAKRFADVTSSEQEPIEVCGVEGQVDWMLAMTCSDGSNPFKGDWDAAHKARTGSTGAGGRCNAIIDVYEAKCPEKTYQVYMDMYVCPRD